MIAVVDYKAGNLFSVCNSLAFLSMDYTVTASPAVLESAQGIILPGVGAFADAMGCLRQAGLAQALRMAAASKPLLGICLGMQVLFDRGYEFGETAGLGLIPGEVRALEAPGLKIPHMGWNSTQQMHPCALSEGLSAEEYFYFVHSYRAVTDDAFISLSTQYGETVPALVHRGHVYGAQFHPEKSARAGLHILNKFGELTNQ